MGRAATLTDVDGNTLATGDGRAYVIFVVSRAKVEKAAAVAKGVPVQLASSGNLRIVTVINFNGRLAGVLHRVALARIRSRLAEEAKTLQSRYETAGIRRSARDDLHAAADFSGAMTSGQFGPAAAGRGFSLFVFAPGGGVVAEWSQPPSNDVLLAALRRAR